MLTSSQRASKACACFRCSRWNLHISQPVTERRPRLSSTPRVERSEGETERSLRGRRDKGMERGREGEREREQTQTRGRTNRNMIELTVLTCRSTMLPNMFLKAERAVHTLSVSLVGLTCQSSAQWTDADSGGETPAKVTLTHTHVALLYPALFA